MTDSEIIFHAELVTYVLPLGFTTRKHYSFLDLRTLNHEDTVNTIKAWSHENPINRRKPPTSRLLRHERTTEATKCHQIKTNRERHAGHSKHCSSSKQSFLCLDLCRFVAYVVRWCLINRGFGVLIRLMGPSCFHDLIVFTVFLGFCVSHLKEV